MNYEPCRELDKLAREYELRVDVQHWGDVAVPERLRVTLEVWRVGERYEVETIGSQLSAAIAELIPAVRAKIARFYGPRAEADAQAYHAQATIYDAVAARGYTDGYRPEELAGRQVLKSLEELCEAFEHLYPLMTTNGQQDTFEDLRDSLVQVKRKARALFDGRMLVGVWKPDEFKLELADVAIPLFVAAQALGIDLVELAVTKATADVKRGVRQ
jgi:hypothetical protein